jgi:hypothetical protein
MISVIDAAQQLATLEFVVQNVDHSIQIVNPNIPLGPTYNPAFNGFLPTGGSISGTAYVLDFSNPAKVVAIDASGSRDLSFIQNPTYGLTVWRGGQGTSSLLAWGTQLSGNNFRTTNPVPRWLSAETQPLMIREYPRRSAIGSGDLVC